MKRYATLFAALAVLLTVPCVQPVNASSNVMFILDGSGSMWGKVDGKPKIEVAKNVLSGMLKDLPPDTKVGLVAYGHRKKDDCKDVELLSKVGSDSIDIVTEKVRALNPKGKTPIDEALSFGFENLNAAERRDEKNYMVLISDGVETCGGSPCEKASSLAKQGVDVKFHVVGFDVSDTERKDLECIARNGNGRYFQASNTEGLKLAIAEVKKEVAKPEKPEPKKSELKEYFFDDFDGEELKDQWEVINPNPDNFIVEDGHLLVISSTPADLVDENVENLFRLDMPLPKGDWIITAKMKVDIQTFYERPFIGIYDNKDNFLIVRAVAPDVSYTDSLAKILVESVKCTKGKISSFEKLVFQQKVKDHKDQKEHMEVMKGFQPLLLRLRKQGRSYFGGAYLEGAESPKWVEPGKLTLLRSKGSLVLGIYQEEKPEGETLLNIDWVKIETTE